MLGNIFNKNTMFQGKPANAISNWLSLVTDKKGIKILNGIANYLGIHFSVKHTNQNGMIDILAFVCAVIIFQ